MFAEVERLPRPVVVPVEVARVPAVRRLAGVAAPYLYVLPALVVFSVWVYRPLGLTFRYSFLSWNLLPSTPQRHVGWANYRRIVELPEMRQAIHTTLFYVGGLLVVGVVIPVLVGVVLNQLAPRSRSVYRGILFLPVLVSPIVAATVWSFLLAPNGGLVNTVGGWVGMAPKNWLLVPDSAREAILTIAAWKVLGIAVLIVAAGLSALDPDYYAAAAVDGASRLRVFREVTLPLLSPTIIFLVTTSVLISEAAFVFPLLNSLTQGGPGTATTDVYYLLYRFGFTSFDVGLASAAAVLFFIVFSLIAIACVTLLDRLSFHDS